ncbi:hypothetical protein BC940DRAFT_237234 [Gongronella butleri]|nr:hypothetical protein BC940DRAFT_237234 [Gongronella butleri]
MATSKTDIVVCGLTLTVYGLEEYKQLPKNTPVAVLFAIHGRLQEKGRMQPIAESLCQLNTSRAADQRHLIVVAYDQLNHGTRLVEKRANFSWKEGKHQNASHAMDMWRMIRSGANTISELIDVLEHYLFDTRPVQLWGCLGFSLGGHIAFLAGANGKNSEWGRKKQDKKKRVQT